MRMPTCYVHAYEWFHPWKCVYILCDCLILVYVLITRKEKKKNNTNNELLDHNFMVHFGY